MGTGTYEKRISPTPPPFFFFLLSRKSWTILKEWKIELYFPLMASFFCHKFVFLFPFLLFLLFLHYFSCFFLHTHIWFFNHVFSLFALFFFSSHFFPSSFFVFYAHFFAHFCLFDFFPFNFFLFSKMSMSQKKSNLGYRNDPCLFWLSFS